MPAPHPRSASPLLLLPLPLVLAGCALMSVKRSHPQTAGELLVEDVEITAARDPDRTTVLGLDAPVQIHRDAAGVPHIRAQTEHDLWFAVGFVHAQDRLWQMDLIRRLGQGRVAEWLGPEAVEFDAFMGALELDRRYAEAVPEAEPALVAVGEAYAAGVNAGAASLPALPVEYRLLGVDFEPWRVQDALAATTLNSWALSENVPKEIITLLLRDRLDAETATALWRWDPDSPAVDTWWDELRQEDIAPLAPHFLGLIEFLWGVHDPSASNNWVLAGSRTASGSPLLANDPHLLQLVPSVWYVHEGRGGPVHIAGAALAGTPFPASGHNERVAWGVTNVMADYTDLAVLERVGSQSYRLAGDTHELRPVEVQIPVKGQKTPESRTVYWTEVGPVISTLEGSHILALRWNLLEITDGTGQLFYDIQRAHTTEDALSSAATTPSGLSQNLVVADVDGHIGWQVFGSIPSRRAHSGRVPYPASAPEHGWDGWLTELPGQRDPDLGYIRTANSPPEQASGKPHPLSHQISTAYMPPWRQERIAELIEGEQGGDGHTVASMLEIQKDEHDAPALTRIGELLEGIESARDPEDPELPDCARILLDWDGHASKDVAAPAVWAVFQGLLIHDVLDPVLGPEGTYLYTAAAVSGRTVLDADLAYFLPEDARPAVVGAALVETCQILAKDYGSKDVSDWRWGELHPLKIRHPFSDATRLLEGWSLEERPWGGTHQTVNQAGFSWFAEDLATTWMASLRVITPLDDVGDAVFIYPGGQSGMPKHPHYRDLYETYVAGEVLPLWFDDEDVVASAVETLTLVPADGGDPEAVAAEVARVEALEAERAAAAAEEAAAARWVPSSGQIGAIQVLSARDGDVDCGAFGALEMGELVEIVEEVAQPPWVGVRGAACLVALYGAEAEEGGAVEAVLLRWVSEGEWLGLGYLVLNLLDELPEGVAMRVARAAVTVGPDPEGARERVLKAGSGAVRGVVGE